jgi:hypothetical protein
MQQEDLFKKIYFHRTGKNYINSDIYQYRYIKSPVKSSENPASRHLILRILMERLLRPGLPVQGAP